MAFALSSAVRPCVCFFGLWFLVVLQVFYCAISVPLVSGAGAVLIVLGLGFLGTEFPWLVQKESESVPGFVLRMRLWTWIGLEWGVKRTICTFFGLG